MARDSPLSTLLVVGIAALTVLSGCSAALGGDMTADEISERIESKHDDIESYEATVVTTIEDDNDTERTEMDVAAKPAYGMYRSGEIDPETGNETLVVSNGTTTWYYDESANTVQRMDGAGNTGQLQTNYTRFVEQLTSNYAITLNGTETVADREAYVVELSAMNDSEQIVENRTVWIDRDRWFPVKQTYEMQLQNETTTITTEYRNLSFDTGLDNSTFEFEPPANATVETLTMPTIDQYDDRSAAADNVSFDLPEPSVPDDFAFEQATVTRDGGNVTATLSYANDSSSLRVTKSDTPNGGSAGDAETVSIDGVNGTYHGFGTSGLVRWDCGEFGYTVTGDLPKDDLIDVAESIDCGDD